MWYANGSTVIIYFFGVYESNVVVPICVYNVSVVSILNILGVFLNVVTWLTLLVLDLVLYLCVPVPAILMSLFPLQGSHGAVVLTYPFLNVQGFASA